MEPIRRTPKLEDVAEQAGVSTASVSRYLNNPKVVAPATAERIRSAIEQTGYVPNLVAVGLASNRSRLVAVTVPDMSLSLFSDTVEAMVEELSADGYVVMLGVTGSDNSKLPNLVNAALARRVDAIVLTGIVEDLAMRERLRGLGVTVIETWGFPADPIDVAIGFSHKCSGVELARFLKGRGYQRPHLVFSDSARAKQRRDAFAEAWLSDTGVTPTRQGFARQTSFGDGGEAFRALKTLPVRPDVVVCSSDWLAQGVLVEALTSGLRVPEDIAVVGFGNLNIAAETRPSITTVEVDGARIGQETARVLRLRAEGKEPESRHIDVGFRLIARESA